MIDPTEPAARGVSGRVLIISEDFLPSAVIGARRPGKFCKFLPGFGWAVRVLTVREEYAAQRDAEPDAAFLSRCEIVRTKKLGLPWLVQAPVDGLHSAVRRIRGMSNLDIGMPGAARSMWWVRHVYPDPGMAWVRPALRAGLEAVRGCDCIWSTYPWGGNHIVAMKLAGEANIPWVADFRDPWSFGARQPSLAGWKQRFNRRMERRTVEQCRFIVSTTDAITDRFRETYPELDPSKFVTIRNGVDPEDFPEGSEPCAREDSRLFRMAYFGTVYMGRDPNGLFEAIGRSLKDGLIQEDRFRLELYGRKSALLEEAIRRHGVESVVRIRALLPYRQALRMMRECTALVVIGSERTDDLCLATKLYEYLYARRPILSLVPPGPIRDFVQEHDAGEAVRGSDVGRIVEIISRWYDDYFAGRLSRPPEHFPQEYDRQYQAGQLADLLDESVRG